MTRQFLTPIVLPADPVAAMEAATKQYADGHGKGWNGHVTTTTESAGITTGLSGIGLGVGVLFDAARRYKFTAQVSVRSTVANDTAWLHLYDATTPVTLAYSCLQLTTASNTQTMNLTYINTASLSGVRSIQMLGIRAAGTGVLTYGLTGHPAMLLIEDIGKF